MEILSAICLIAWQDSIGMQTPFSLLAVVHDGASGSLNSVFFLWKINFKIQLVTNVKKLQAGTYNVALCFLQTFSLDQTT